MKSNWVGALCVAATAAILADAASAQSAFVKVGPEAVYDAGDRCGVPFWDVADFNRDGRPDFALFAYPYNVWFATDASTWKPAAVMLWVAQPDGSYQEMASEMFNGPVTAAYASQLRIGDFNGDGIPDIYLPSYGLDNSTGTPDTPKLALSTPSGYVDASAQFANLVPRLTHTGAIADIDGNGTVDLYVGSNTGAPVPGKKPYLLVNDGSGNFTYTQALLPTVVLSQQPAQGARSQQMDGTRWYVADERFTGSEFADVNRDGYPDLVLEPGPYAPNGFVFLNDRLGDFSKLPPIELPPGAYGGNWLIYELKDPGWFNSPQERAPGPGTVHLDTRAVELNGDGYPDLVVLQTLQQESPEKLFYRGGRVQILINQNGRGFVDERAARGAPGFDVAVDHDSYHSTLTVAEVNGDGFPDLIAIQVGADFTPHVYLNDGNGRFTRTRLTGIPENGLFIVVSGGFRQPTRLVNVRFNYRSGATGRTGCSLSVQAYERPAAVAATANYQGLWFAAPARSESGWGINFAHQGDTIFATWFTYGLDGKPWWLAVVAHRSAAGVYTGDLFTTTGPPFNAVPFNPAAIVETTVGSATFTFTDSNNGTFAYSIDPGVVTTGVIAQTKSITRQLFGPAPTCVWGEQSNLALVTGYQDLWYGAPPGSESGWGINFTHQGDIIFATWFTYDLNGKPWWLGIVANKTAPGVYSGDLFTTSGPPFNAQPFDPAQVVETTVGTGTLTVRDGNNVEFDYTVNGVTQSKALTRQVFVAPGTMCQ